VGEDFVEQLHTFLSAHSFFGQMISDDLVMKIIKRPNKSISDQIVLKYPNFIPTIYTELGLKANVYVEDKSLFATASLYKSQSMPVLMQIPVSLQENSKSLEDMLVRVLTMSIAGYQFLQPRTYYDLKGGAKPELEWTIRWIQGWFLLESFLSSS